MYLYLGAGVEKPGVGVGSLRCEQMELVTALAFQLFSRLTTKGQWKSAVRKPTRPHCSPQLSWFLLPVTLHPLLSDWRFARSPVVNADLNIDLGMLSFCSGYYQSKLRNQKRLPARPWLTISWSSKTKIDCQHFSWLTLMLILGLAKQYDNL